MSNVLSELLSPTARRTTYLVYGLLGLALGATQVGYSAANLQQPVWLTVALAVFAFLGTGLGIVAAGNTPSSNAARKTARILPVDPPDAPQA